MCALAKSGLQILPRHSRVLWRTFCLGMLFTDAAVSNESERGHTLYLPVGRCAIVLTCLNTAAESPGAQGAVCSVSKSKGRVKCIHYCSLRKCQTDEHILETSLSFLFRVFALCSILCLEPCLIRRGF